MIIQTYIMGVLTGLMTALVIHKVLDILGWL
jgi:hypothetical protein